MRYLHYNMRFYDCGVSTCRTCANCGFQDTPCHSISRINTTVSGYCENGRTVDASMFHAQLLAAE